MTRWIAAVIVATATLALVADRHFLRAQSTAGDGAVGQWTTAQVATGVDSIAATVGGGILVIGGLHDSNVRFQASPPSGTVSSVAALSAPRWSGWAPVYQNYIYVVGGLTGTSLTGASYTRTIERLTYGGGTSFTVQTLGTLLPVTQMQRGSTTSFSTAAGFAIVVNQFLYVFGPAREVFRTAIAADGSLGAWVQSTNYPGTAQIIEGGVVNGALFTLDQAGIIRRTTFASDGTPLDWTAVASSPYRAFAATADTLYRGPTPNQSGNWDYTDATTLGPWTRIDTPTINSCGVAPWAIAVSGFLYVWSPCGSPSTVSRARIGALLVSDMSPREASSSGGTLITLTGSNFTSGLDVRVDDVPARVTVVESKRVVFEAPPHAPGPATVRVVATDGQTWVIPSSSSNALTYVGVICGAFTVNPSQLTFTSAGGTQAVSVTATDASCAWTASSDASWITVPSNGTGSGNVSITATQNTTSVARSGNVVIAGQTVAIQQAASTGSGCGAFTVSVNQLTFAGAGGTQSISITATAAGCPWTASTNASWITVPLSGAGSGTVAITAAQNPTSVARQGNVVIAGRTINVTQQAGSQSGVPGSPTQLVATELNGVVDLRWTPPTTGALAYYVLEAGSLPGASNLAQVPLPPTQATFQAVGVPAGTYYVRLRAWGTSGPGGVSNEIVVRVGICQTAPEPPTNFTIVKLSSTLVRATWSAPAGRVSSYIVQAGSASGRADLANFDTGTSDTTLLANAPPGVYFVRVFGRNDCGVSGASNEFVLVMP